MSETVITLSTEKETVVIGQLLFEDARLYYDAVDNNREYLAQLGDVKANKYPDMRSVEASIVEPSKPDKLRLGIWDGDSFIGSINLMPDEYEAEIDYWLDGRHTSHDLPYWQLKSLPFSPDNGISVFMLKLNLIMLRVAHFLSGLVFAQLTRLPLNSFLRQ
ncbi:hypothetical protein KA531_03480 [Candidatus Saccharibacteria bacterium]|nr:hypothetical protein [Candidatus Saccharibacteria bacterium]